MAKAAAKKPAKKRVRVKVKKPALPPDPRQAAFIDGYTNPESKTFGNSLQSALAAGFAQEYAENLRWVRPKWLSKFIGNESRLHKAEAHLDEVLAIPIITQAMGAFGPVYEKIPTGEFEEKKKRNGEIERIEKFTKVPVMKVNTEHIKVKTKVAEIILPALDPKTYGKKDDKSTPKFVFNLKAARDEYLTPPMHVEVEVIQSEES